MEFTEEHAYGYVVQLWRQGDRVFGFREAPEGLAGDTPIGALEEVQFEPRRSALSFKAKLTMVSHSWNQAGSSPRAICSNFGGLWSGLLWWVR